MITPPPWAGRPATSATIRIDPPLPVTVTWLELRPAGSSPVRVELRPAPTWPSGRSEPEWPTPAEWFLDAVLPELSAAGPDAFGVGMDAAAARQVGGAVADALLAVGALPPGSALLGRYPIRDDAWHHELSGRYAARANRDLVAAEPTRRVTAVGAAVPLETAVAVFDAVVVQGSDVWMHAYVFPDAVGEHWPVSLRPFRIRASDDLGQQHCAIAATYRRSPDHEGTEDMWLWPPLDPAARQLRLTVSTPWEAAWVEIPLHGG